MANSRPANKKTSADPDSIRLQTTAGYTIVTNWFLSREMHPFAFQEETWMHITEGHSGLVNAPTGCGKTFAVSMTSTAPLWRRVK